jgi:peptidoglycan/xylan/chitin deacetylase (PgdA/CDA1 family)
MATNSSITSDKKKRVAYTLTRKRILTSILIIAILLSASTTPALARTMQPSGYVIYRIDDIQSGWLPNVQNQLLSKFITSNTKASLAVIPNEMNNQGLVFTKIKKGIDYNLFEIAAHGWNHVNYSKLDLGSQYTTIAKSKQKLQQMFDISLKVFVPPFNTFDKNTLQSLVMLGFNVISADEKSIPKVTINKIHEQTDTANIYRIPETIEYMDYNNGKWVRTPSDTIINKVTSDIKKYGFAVITLHPQNFAMMKKGVFVDKLNQKELNSLGTLMNTIKQQNYKSIVFEDIVKMSMEKQRSRIDVIMGRNE